MSCTRFKSVSAGASRGFLLTASVLAGSSLPLLATSVIPVTDQELYNRADVIVYGIVDSTEVEESSSGDPQTVSVIKLIKTLKGGLFGDTFVIRQAGGALPDGRFLKIWGRPDYRAGSEVIIFALSRPEGDFQTAELLLGKFEVMKDEAGKRYAVPDLARGVPAGVTIHTRSRNRDSEAQPLAFNAATGQPHSLGRARPLDSYLSYLMNGAKETVAPAADPVGELRPVDGGRHVISPAWGMINSLWRWTNGASAVWTLQGTANITGGGTAEAQRALATWTNEPNSSINYTAGSGSTNIVNLNAATSSDCGWSSCFTGSGVIGCGGISGGGSNSWRGENYTTITGGSVAVRCYASFNGVSSIITESVILHELGHTLGLGHSDQNVSSHDVCRGDESAATMRSSVQNRTTLGSDDVDAVRWLYGDGGNWCNSGATPPAVTTNAASSITQTGAVLNGTVNPNGKSTNGWFQWGTTVAYGNTTFSQGLGSGSSNVPLAQAISGIPCNTLYHFRAVAQNSDGTTNGPDQTLTTSTCESADFNGDGRADLVWRNTSTGDNTFWFMQGTNKVGGGGFESVPDVNWKIAATGDFDGNGQSDLAWRNTSTGQNAIWIMNGNARIGSGTLDLVADQNWQIVGSADLNSDGKGDLIWRNGATGENAFWLISGLVKIGGGSLDPVADTTWKIAGAGDFDGDGKGDLAWWNSATGDVVLWLMNGTLRSVNLYVSRVADTQWELKGVGDFSGDGKADLAWRNKNTGDGAMWMMNGATLVTGGYFGTVSDLNWALAGPR